jgi:hypothetical protein
LGVPQALSTRIVPALALSLAAFTIMMTDRSHVSGQTPGPVEGTVRIMPPISTAPIQDGPFDVYIVLDNLQHFGTITYDDNQDGIPDRGVPSTGMGAFEFTLQFDPTIIALDSAEPGPDLNRSGRNYQCLPPRRDEPDKFTFGCISLEQLPAGPQGSLTLATVTIRPLARGSSPLLLQAGLAGPLGDDAPVQGVGAVVRTTGRTVAVTTATAAPSVTNATPGATSTTSATPTEIAAGPTSTTPSATQPTTVRTPTRVAPGNGGDGNSEAKNNRTLGAAFWSLVAVGGVATIGALGLVVAFLRRSKRWGV